MAKIAVVGLGCLGGMFASLFVESGHQVTVLGDGDRLERFRQSGFTVNERLLDVQYSHPLEAEIPDLILVAVKYPALEQAARLVKPLINSDTIVLSVLNGIDSEEFLENYLQIPPLLICFSQGSDSYKTPDGRGITFSNPGLLVFGEKDGKVSDRVQRVDSILGASPRAYWKLSTTILHDSWWKFMLNVGTSQPAAILRAPYGALRSIQEIREISLAAMQEVVACSQYAGANLNDADIDLAFGKLPALPADGTPSMLQDMAAGRKTEVEIFAKKVCELGKIYGVDTPVNFILYNMIRALEIMAGL